MLARLARLRTDITTPVVLVPCTVLCDAGFRGVPVAHVKIRRRMLLTSRGVGDKYKLVLNIIVVPIRELNYYEFVLYCSLVSAHAIS